MEPVLYRLRPRPWPWEVDRVLRECTTVEVEAIVEADVWNRQREEELVARLGAWVQDGFGVRYDPDEHPTARHLLGREIAPSYDPRSTWQPRRPEPSEAEPPDPAAAERIALASDMVKRAMSQAALRRAGKA